ncbi:unnamed protein product [Nesidiocoris tenuis]|uniref:Uncharacterized protein n=1 Tax=Nesidiocoris tenuis TaxID=355587 RepID=A0A6H5H9J1_9HEMI|nr:unnamed protein product [Nesidiocoris tenuis]
MGIEKSSDDREEDDGNVWASRRSRDEKRAPASEGSPKSTIYISHPCENSDTTQNLTILSYWYRWIQKKKLYKSQKPVLTFGSSVAASLAFFILHLIASGLWTVIDGTELDIIRPEGRSDSKISSVAKLFTKVRVFTYKKSTHIERFDEKLAQIEK